MSRPTATASGPRPTGRRCKKKSPSCPTRNAKRSSTRWSSPSTRASSDPSEFTRRARCSMLAPMKDPVASTALLVAALRAEESERDDRLFDDPFARDLAGDEGRAALAAYRAAAVHGTVPIIEVRTRFFDEAILLACASGVRQVAVLAAGMDARAFRLAWPEETRVFEIDQLEIIEAKARVLASAKPRCSRVAIAANLAEDWPKLLEARGFDRRDRTIWLVEGLLQY